MRHAIVCFGVGLQLMVGGCAALTGVKGGADAVKGAADDAKSQKDSASATVKDEKDKAKGDKAAGGAEAPAGPTRLEATDGPINAPINDKIDVKKQKQNDWRKFQLLGKPGIATFELHWDEDGANLDIDIYDKFGVKIGKSPPRLEGQSSKKILVQIEDPGVYYVKVSGPTKSDNSIYTMMVKWKGPAAPPPSQTAAAAPAPAAAPVAAPAAAAAPAPCPPGQNCPTPPDPNKVYGTIVSMVREGSTVTLYLDKGSGDQLRSGMAGTVLDGPEGDKPFEGGSFAIAQVVGSSKSIAKTTTLQKPLGKNKRIVVNLK